MGFAVTPDGRYYAYSYFTDQNQLTSPRGPGLVEVSSMRLRTRFAPRRESSGR